jgi:hypothetical protein
VQVHVEVQGGAEALDEGERTAASTTGAGQSGSSDQAMTRKYRAARYRNAN